MAPRRSLPLVLRLDARVLPQMVPITSLILRPRPRLASRGRLRAHPRSIA